MDHTYLNDGMLDIRVSINYTNNQVLYSFKIIFGVLHYDLKTKSKIDSWKKQNKNQNELFVNV